MLGAFRNMFKELENTLNEVDPTYRSNAGFGTIDGLANGFANLMIGAGVSIAMIALVYAFILFMMSEGDPKNIQKAKNAALWSTVSLAVSLLAVAIKSALFSTVGMQ